MGKSSSSRKSSSAAIKEKDKDKDNDNNTNSNGMDDDMTAILEQAILGFKVSEGLDQNNQEDNDANDLDGDEPVEAEEEKPQEKRSRKRKHKQPSTTVEPPEEPELFMEDLDLDEDDEDEYIVLYPEARERIEAIRTYRATLKAHPRCNAIRKAKVNHTVMKTTLKNALSIRRVPSNATKNFEVMAKGLIAVLMEDSRRVMNQLGHKGPIRPMHLREAYRRFESSSSFANNRQKSMFKI